MAAVRKEVAVEAFAAQRSVRLLIMDRLPTTDGSWPPSSKRSRLRRDDRTCAGIRPPAAARRFDTALLACTWWLNEQGERPNQIAVAAQAGTHIKMTSQVLRSLERKGLIDRDVDAADTRARRLRVTGQGARLAPRAIAVVERVGSEFFADVPQPEALRFLRRLMPKSEAVRR